MFDPSSDGPGAIRGGCTRCQDLQTIFDNHQCTVRLMRTFAPPSMPKKRTKAVETRQHDLFAAL